jgi:hypothetical protein
MNPFKIYLLLITVVLSTVIHAQSYNNYFGTIVNQCSFDSIDNYLTEFENLGIKEHGSIELNNTLTWLINKYTNYGYSNIEIDTFNYFGIDNYNLIVTKQGSIYPNTYLIVDGHYDTKIGTGTNDNGSGVSIILETARLLQNIDTEYSIKFINFGAEEDGLLGSTHYVNNTVNPSSLDIKLLFNIDEVGGVNGMLNNTIVCERDESVPTASNAASANYTDTLANCVSLYSNLSTDISYAYSSDYMPFQNNGEIITGFYEKNSSPYTHSPNDLKVNMDVNYVYEVAKATIGASLYFAVASLPTIIEKKNKTNILIYPNPVQEVLTINIGENYPNDLTLKLTNSLGKTVIEKQINNTKEQLNLSHFPSGIYTLIISSSTIRITEKIIH